MVGEWIVCSHGPAIRGNGVNFDVKIAADGGACDAVDFSVEIGSGVEVSRNGIRGKARVVGIADRVVPPKRRGRIEVLVHATKQIDIGAVACAAEPATRLRQWSDRRPGIARRVVLISVCDSAVVNDAAETINVATYRDHSVPGDGDGIGRLLGPGADRRARRRGGRCFGRTGVRTHVEIAWTRTNRFLRIGCSDNCQNKSSTECCEASYNE